MSVEEKYGRGKGQKKKSDLKPLLFADLSPQELKNETFAAKTKDHKNILSQYNVKKRRIINVLIQTDTKKGDNFLYYDSFNEDIIFNFKLLWLFYF